MERSGFKIVMVPDLNNCTCVEPAELYPKDAVPPYGYELSGGERKFIVARCDHVVVLATGPAMDGREYYHAEIFSAIKDQTLCDNCREMNPAGGGLLKFIRRNEKCWAALFNGKSGTMGIYDPIILGREFQKKISESFGVTVNFVWDSRA